MNTKELLKVKEQILRNPESLDMQVIICGTTACLAGHICINNGLEPDVNGGFCRLADGRDTFTVVRHILKITHIQSRRLFYLSGWPEDLYKRYKRARTAKNRAKVTAERIDRFIESKGERV